MNNNPAAGPELVPAPREAGLSIAPNNAFSIEVNASELRKNADGDEIRNTHPKPLYRQFAFICVQLRTLFLNQATFRLEAQATLTDPKEHPV